MILGDNASSRIFLWDKCNYCRNNPSLIMKGLTLLKNYYIVEDIGEEYEESGNSQSEGIQIVKFSKQLEKESLYQERQVYKEMVKNMYEGLTLSVTVTYGDGTTEIVDVGFKAVDDSDGSGKVSDKVAVYVK